jgi:hypothetical protein
VGYTSAQTGPHTDTHQEERPVTVGDASAQTGLQATGLQLPNGSTIIEHTMAILVAACSVQYDVCKVLK